MTRCAASVVWLPAGKCVQHSWETRLAYLAKTDMPHTYIYYLLASLCFMGVSIWLICEYFKRTRIILEAHCVVNLQHTLWIQHALVSLYFHIPIFMWPLQVTIWNKWHRKPVAVFGQEFSSCCCQHNWSHRAKWLVLVLSSLPNKWRTDKCIYALKIIITGIVHQKSHLLIVPNFYVIFFLIYSFIIFFAEPLHSSCNSRWSPWH